MRIENHGSICLARPETAAQREWLLETAPEDAQFFGDALALEPRYVGDFLAVAATSNMLGRDVR